jgi:hypothetical protein
MLRKIPIILLLVLLLIPCSIRGQGEDESPLILSEVNSLVLLSII